MLSFCFRIALLITTVMLFACSDAAEQAARAAKNGKGSLDTRPVTAISPGDEIKFFGQNLSVVLSCTDAQNDCKKTYYSTAVAEPDQSSGNEYRGEGFSIGAINNTTTTVAY
ncbi:MAG: hypothetical protein ACC707_14920 [Thiohalomonadales bacterium]